MSYSEANHCQPLPAIMCAIKLMFISFIPLYSIFQWRELKIFTETYIDCYAVRNAIKAIVIYVIESQTETTFANYDPNRQQMA